MSDSLSENINKCIKLLAIKISLAAELAKVNAEMSSKHLKEGDMEAYKLHTRLCQGQTKKFDKLRKQAKQLERIRDGKRING